MTSVLIKLGTRVARIREIHTDPDPFGKIFTDPDPDPDPKRIRPIPKNCYEISKNPNIFEVRQCNSDLIALFFKYMSSKTKFVQNSIKILKSFCYLVNKIAKKSRFLSKSYGSGERIRIRKDPSILTDPDPDPFGQKSTDPDPDSDPDPRNPDRKSFMAP